MSKHPSHPRSASSRSTCNASELVGLHVVQVSLSKLRHQLQSHAGLTDHAKSQFCLHNSHCACVCVWICMCLYIYIYIYIYISLSLSLCVRARAHVRACVCVRVRPCACVLAHACACVRFGKSTTGSLVVLSVRTVTPRISTTICDPLQVTCLMNCISWSHPEMHRKSR